MRWTQVIIATTAALYAAEIGSKAAIGRPIPDIFKVDTELGVRLRPNACASLRSPSGRVTDIRIDKNGYRGSTGLPAQLFLIGDSQVFGYHAEAHETAAAQVGELSEGSAHAANLGVPTYGPMEYAEVGVELATAFDSRADKTIWIIFNELNDYAEARVANRLRTTACENFPCRPENKRKNMVTALRSMSNLVDAIYWRSRRTRVVRPSIPSQMRFLSDMSQDEHNQIVGAVHKSVERIRQACAQNDCTVRIAILPPAPRIVRALSRHAQRNLTKLRTSVLEREQALDLKPTLDRISTAFLDNDPHLTPRGHAAVAYALLDQSRVGRAWNRVRKESR